MRQAFINEVKIFPRSKVSQQSAQCAALQAVHATITAAERTQAGNEGKWQFETLFTF